MKIWDPCMGQILEVLRTIKRAELAAFLCPLKKMIGPIKVHADNKGITDGPWRGERECTEGNEKGDQLAKQCALLDEGFMAHVRANTVQQERDEVYAAPQYTVSFHLVEEWKESEELKPKPKEKWSSVDKTSEEPKH